MVDSVVADTSLSRSCNPQPLRGWVSIPSHQMLPAVCSVDPYILVPVEAACMGVLRLQLVSDTGISNLKLLLPGLIAGSVAAVPRAS